MSNNYKTNETNEEKHKLGIDINDLPKTIADAVKLCCELNISYLQFIGRS